MAFKIPYSYDSIKNYTGSRQKSHEIVKMPIFRALAKAKLDIESTKGSYLVAVRITIYQLSRQWLYPSAVYER